MKPKQVRTLHEGIEIPPVKPERPRDPYRRGVIWAWIVLLGAPICTVALVNDFLWLPNHKGRYSSAAAWRDWVVSGKATLPRSGGAYVTSLGVSWPLLHVVAWEDAEGWHAASPNESIARARLAGGSAVIPWQEGGNITVMMPPPDTRVGLWALSTEILPEVSMSDPVTATVSPASLPAEATEAIRAALVRHGGDAAGPAFDSATSAIAPGFWMMQRPTPLGPFHNLLAFFALLAMILFWALWPMTFRWWRRYRRGLCFRCAYPLGGVTIHKCPECGFPFRRSARYPQIDSAS
ncbi:MAG: hypothetical protein R3B57_14420 [Phycisphaerales bacterium]